MKLGEVGFKLITSFESLKLDSYKDQAGVWTIGYGTTKLNGAPVTPGMTINERVAEALFYGEIDRVVKVVTRFVVVPLNQNQLDALVSFCYNVGDGAFISSTLINYINNRKVITEDLFTRWNKYTDPNTGEKKVSNGLTRRRKSEYLLFTSKDRLPSIDVKA